MSAKHIPIMICCAGVAMLTRGAIAQGSVGNGTFQNLNFESATVPMGYQDPQAPTSEAFPGWTVYLGDVPQSSVGYNNFPLNGEAAALLGAAGSYSAYLIGSQFPGFGAPDVSISQTAVVPAGANSIQLLAQWSMSPFSVSLNGSIVPLYQIGSSSAGTIFGGNISQYSGESAELRVSVSNLGIVRFNDISFSSQSVPEPRIWALAILGCLLGFRELRGEMPPDCRRNPTSPL